MTEAYPLTWPAGRPRTPGYQVESSRFDTTQAIRKTIDALRGIGRWGTGDMVDAAFTGFDALPPPSYAAPAPSWHVVLGVHPDMSLQQCEAAYRDLARIHHPDNGGNGQVMAEINHAIATARRLKS